MSVAASPVRLAVVAGFEPDLREAIAAHGLGVTLGDVSPFTERFRELVAADLDVLATLLGDDAGPSAFDRTPGDAAEGCEVLRLSRSFVAALARHDDTRVRALLERFVTVLGWPRIPAGDFPDAFRGLVIQARAAVVNGWVVLAVRDLRDGRPPAPGRWP